MAFRFKTSMLAAAASLLGAHAHAQTLPTVQITGRAAEQPVALGGFGDTAVAKLPFQAEVLNAELLTDLGVRQLAGLTSLDASVGDSYNATGYISYLKVRGFDIDNQYNYRRDGLPISADTILLFDNKSAIEVLKGTSGIQAGTSAPGGMVNLVVKRPTAQDFTTMSLGLSERGTVEASVDTSQHLGHDLSLRINAAGAQLEPQLRDAQGSRRLLAAALDWLASPDTLVQLEGEWSRQAQPSQPGFSLLGAKLPSAADVDPRINLNNQPWSQSGIFSGETGSVRVEQRLNADWKLLAHVGLQHLRNDDRLAFAYGCSAENNYTSYCSDGSFDFYDYRSDNERRNTAASEFSLAGTLQTGTLRHELNLGLQASHFWSRLGGQAYNWVGIGNVNGTAIVPANPATLNTNTDRDESSTELFLRDAIAIDAQWRAWIGARHTQLTRASHQTDGSSPTRYSQSFTTPWLGLSYALSSQHLLYASWGEGVQSQVVPNLPGYLSAGQALPALRSRQFELGLKAGSNTVDWSLALFDIHQPVWTDNGSSVTPDGEAHHRGVEAQADLKWSGGGLLLSGLQLRARREGSSDASIDDKQPVNVPETTLKLHARQDLAPGLQAQAGLVYESSRQVLPDNSLQVPAWTRLDAGLRYTQGTSRQLYVWRLGVDNLTDRRAWRESPFQYGHVYLYPMAPRTWRVSLEVQI
ncbi:MAG: TonB-dependent receptor [Paucibacter sp.]|nr:TonB-dependent receptor [Roseateles sp.]